jgi:predicted double-glycine peptidase
MIFRYHGVLYSEEELRIKLLTRKDIGTYHQAMIAVARSEGFYCYVNEGSTLEELSYYVLAHKLPAIVHYIEPSSEEDHYAIVSGVTPDAVVLDDPWNGDGFTIPRREFKRRWRGEIVPSERWMMIVSPEDLSLGHHYHPLQR